MDVNNSNLQNSKADGEISAITVGMGGAAVRLWAQFNGCSNSGSSACSL